MATPTRLIRFGPWHGRAGYLLQIGQYCPSEHLPLSGQQVPLLHTDLSPHPQSGSYGSKGQPGGLHRPAVLQLGHVCATPLQVTLPLPAPLAEHCPEVPEQEVNAPLAHVMRT